MSAALRAAFASATIAGACVVYYDGRWAVLAVVCGAILLVDALV